MPKLKQPATLEKLAIQTLVRTVEQWAIKAIRSGICINTRDLQEYFYGELPEMLSREITAHMLVDVSRTLVHGGYKKTDLDVLRTLFFGDYKKTDVTDFKKGVLLAIVCHSIRVLDLTNAPSYAVETLSCNMETFTKLHTLIFPDHNCPANVVETLAAGRSSYKYLVHFRMQRLCTDAIIETVGSCCYATIQHIHVNYSKNVTDASFKILLECRELKHISIFYTAMTPEGFFEFLEHKRSEDTAVGILGLAVGPEYYWGTATSTQLSLIPTCCPILKQLEISTYSADMDALIGLTKLEELRVHCGHFTKCHLDSFIRVRGSNITSFELKYIQSIDLTFILNHCVNIRRLSVSYGSILGNLKSVPKACQNLEILHLSCASFRPSIEGSILNACVNVTRLDLCTYPGEITDEHILNVLYKNPLQKLTSFTVYSRMLTVRSLNAIIEHCPLLKDLQCFECRAISHEDVEILRQEINSRNQDLRIDFTYSYKQ